MAEHDGSTRFPRGMLAHTPLARESPPEALGIALPTRPKGAPIGPEFTTGKQLAAFINFEGANPLKGMI
jgi:hypothetical protein